MSIQPEWGTQDFRTERAVRVLLVDDQVSVREMVAMVLDREGKYAVVAETASGMEALRLLRKHRPVLAIVGLALPEMGGAEVIHTLREEDKKVRLLVYTGSRNRELLLSGLAARPHGFVHKTEPLSTFRQAVAAVAQGFSFLSPYATRLMDKARPEQDPKGALTVKQRTVLQLVAEGLSSKQVAARLSMSPKTVEHHRTQLMQKLGLRDVASLTRYAVRCGLVDAD